MQTQILELCFKHAVLLQIILLPQPTLMCCAWCSDFWQPAVKTKLPIYMTSGKAHCCHG